MKITFFIFGKINNFLKIIFLWIWGGALYTLCELLWRGYSHPSMFVVGGLCFVAMGGISIVSRRTAGFIKQTMFGTAAVTAIELVSGLILNKSLGMSVWDYSKLPFNLLGQICPQYVIAWIPLTAFGILLNGQLKQALFGEPAQFAGIFRYVIFILKPLSTNVRNTFTKRVTSEPLKNNQI